MNNRSIPRLCLSVPLLLMGCDTPTIGENAEKIFKKYCTDYEQCAEARFSNSWNSVEQCTNRYMDDFVPADTRGEDSSCDGSEANYCVDDLEAAGCPDAYGSVIPSERCTRCWTPK